MALKRHFAIPSRDLEYVDHLAASYWEKLLAKAATDDEQELCSELSEILGAVEMSGKNGRKWRERIRLGPDERLALRATIEDYNLNRWFFIQYQRNLIRIVSRWRHRIRIKK
jgi:hypothetical protein